MRRRLCIVLVVAGCAAVAILGLHTYRALAAGAPGAIVEAVAPTADIQDGHIGEGTILIVTGKQPTTAFAQCFGIPDNPNVELVDAVAINPGDGAQHTLVVVPDLNELGNEYRGGTRFTVVSIGTDECNFNAAGGAIDIDLTRVTLQEI